MGVGIEFVKHYRAHLSPILALAVSSDGATAATVASDAAVAGQGGNVKQEGSIKVFDVENFDMINIITLPYKPSTACWVHPRGQARTLLAVAEQDSHVIRIYDGRGTGEPVMTVENVHKKGTTVDLIAVSGCPVRFFGMRLDGCYGTSRTESNLSSTNSTTTSTTRLSVPTTRACSSTGHL